MKRNPRALTKTLVALYAMFVWSPEGFSQEQVAGSWEGTFMGDFRTVIELRATEEKSYTGKIFMFSGENIIQDDQLSNINLEMNRLTFRIEAKETGFNGSFNGDFSELSGHFIFPDGSEHPLVVRKGDDSQGSSSIQAEAFLEVKQRLYPAAGLTSDLIFLMDQLEANHPRLHRYTSKQKMDETMNSILKSLDGGMTLEEYYLSVAPLIEMVRCSHTGLRLPDHYQQLVRENGHYFPVNLHILDSQTGYSVYCSAPDNGIPSGSEVLRINQIPVGQIVDQLFTLVPSEGHCMTTKFNELNQNFHAYFNLLDNSQNFEVEFRTPSSTGTIVLQACSYEEAGLHEVAEPFEFYTDMNNGLATLKVATFAFRDIEGYITLMDSLFLNLEKSKVPHLVLDLRGNSGGHPIFAAQLLSYLTDHEFTYFVRNPDVESFEPLYRMMQPSRIHYDGKLYVLVDGGCLSTTGHLISLLKYHTGALFIGEEPGSTFICNDFSIQVALPNTGIQVNIPRTSFETAVSGFNSEEPFPLDVGVEITVDDLKAGRDSYMTQVYNLIGPAAVKP